jgi:hypothetical protein
VFRPVARGERLRNARLTDRSLAKIVKAHAVPRWARSSDLCRSFTAIWLLDQRRGERCIDIQDGRPVAAQEHGHAAGLTFATPRSSRITRALACCESAALVGRRAGCLLHRPRQYRAGARLRLF